MAWPHVVPESRGGTCRSTFSGARQKFRVLRPVETLVHLIVGRPRPINAAPACWKPSSSLYAQHAGSKDYAVNP